MSEDRIEGGLKKAGGKVEDAWGGLTGDTGRQAKGKMDQASGSAQDVVGQVKDRAGEILGEVEAYAKGEPLQAIGVALAVGVVVGFLLHGGRKTVYVRK